MSIASTSKPSTTRSPITVTGVASNPRSKQFFPTLQVDRHVAFDELPAPQAQEFLDHFAGPAHIRRVHDYFDHDVST